MNRRVLTASGVLLQICLLFTSSAAGKTIYVDRNAGGANDGSSWSDAYVRLQSGIAASGSGDEIRVAQGIYRTDPYVGTGSVSRRQGPVDPLAMRYTAFPLKGGVTIQGGFAGSQGLDPDARDVERYETVLSGDCNGNDTDSWGLGNPVYESLRADNSAYVVEARWLADSTAMLDGCVIESAVQGGLCNYTGSPHITNCTFRRNSNLASGGGAAYCQGGKPTFSNCIFQDNSAMIAGGAVYAMETRLTLTNCRFLHNWTVGLGGAIYSVESTLALTDCTFTENAGPRGGAIYNYQGWLTLADCEFEGNSAREQGGAINLIEQESASMTRCSFRGNSTLNWGGAIMNEGVPLLLDACVFSGNRAAWGGAIHTCGPTSLVAGSQGDGTAMTHCLFAGNYASRTGGALWGDHAEYAIGNCTFADNVAEQAATLAWPGSVDSIVCRVTMENCIVWDGDDPISAHTVATRGNAGSRMGGIELTVAYSDVQGGWPGEGNLEADPCFAAPGWWALASDSTVVVSPDDDDATWIEGDYHLKSQAGRWDPTSGTWVLDEVTSPCIDAGDPNSPVGDEPEPNGGRINMGAYGGTAEASKSF